MDCSWPSASSTCALERQIARLETTVIIPMCDKAEQAVQAEQAVHAAQADQAVQAENAAQAEQAEQAADEFVMRTHKLKRTFSRSGSDFWKDRLVNSKKLSMKQIVERNMQKMEQSLRRESNSQHQG